MGLPAYIEIRPDVMMGKACLKGTRIPVYLVLESRWPRQQRNRCSIVRLLVDENISPQQASHLRQRGHDAAAVFEAGLSGQPGETIRSYAIEQNRILLTLDADFANMLRFPPGRHSRCNSMKGASTKRGHDPRTDSEKIQKALTLLNNTDLAGRLAVLHGDVIRIRS